MRRPSDRTRTRIAACAASFALHALGVFGAAHVSWDAFEPEAVAPIEVVWMSELRMPALAVVPIRPVPPQRPPPPEPEFVPEPPEPAPPAEAEPDDSIAEPTVDDELEPEPAPPEPERAAPEPETDSPVDAPERTFVITREQLEEAQRRAIEALREQREREEQYLTFSLDDLVERPPPEEPGPSESIFEAAERYRGRGGPSVLSPGAARTRVGRALAQFCNALTGGFGFGFGGRNFATFCAEPGESPKLFAHLKPAYLRSRPVCREVQMAVAAVDAEAATTIKCELVEQDGSATPEENDLQEEYDLQ